MAKTNKKFTHDAKMVVTNQNLKKVPSKPVPDGFKYVEVEITDRAGIKTKEIVPLHEEQIKKHLK